MDAKNVAWVLLSIPGSVLIAFSGLAISAAATYGLSDVTRSFPVRARNDSAFLRGVARQWWEIQCIVWKRSRRKAIRMTVWAFVAIAGRLIVSAYAGFVATIIVWFPFGLANWFTGEPPMQGIPVVWLVGAILGVTSLTRAMRYACQPERPHLFSNVPEISLLPGQVSWTRRVDFSRNVYRYVQLRNAANASFVLGPLLILTGLSDSRISDSQPSPATWTTQDWYGLLLLLGLLLGGGVTLLLKSGVDAFLPTARAVVTVNECLRSSRSPAIGKRHASIIDPFGQWRAQLSRTTNALMAAGRRVDATAELHPVASILRGCAYYLRAFMASTDSLISVFPSAVKDVLKDTLVVIAGPRSTDSYQQLGHKVSAFEPDGAPKPALRVATASRWTRLIGRLAEFFETYSRLTAALWTLFTLAVVVVLIVTDRLDLTNIQLQK